MLQVMDPPGRLEPFVRLIAEPSKGMDWERLDMLLQARAKLHADTEPGNMTWTFRSDGMIIMHCTATLYALLVLRRQQSCWRTEDRYCSQHADFTLCLPQVHTAIRRTCKRTR